MTKELVTELATVQYSSHNVISEIEFRVYGGSSHAERASAAFDALEAYTEYFTSIEHTVVSTPDYQITGTGYTESGAAYVLFTFGQFDHNEN